MRGIGTANIDVFGEDAFVVTLTTSSESVQFFYPSLELFPSQSGKGHSRRNSYTCILTRLMVGIRAHDRWMFADEVTPSHVSLVITRQKFDTNLKFDFTWVKDIRG